VAGNGADALAEAWPEVDTGVAHPARVYDFWLGGEVNFPADREAARQAAAADPSVVAVVRASRAFLRRAVRYLAAGAGLRQFLDIGTGLPTVHNTPQAAQEAAADCRIVCVDNDPLVLAQARPLLHSTPEGECAYIFADLRDPEGIWQQAAATLDTGMAVAVVMAGVLQHVRDTDGPHRIVSQLMAGLPPGSHLVISHPASDIGAPAGLPGAPVTLRSHAEVTRFFAGLELLAPGVVQAAQWRPDPGEAPVAAPVWCGVARKP
jgi:hypothetical protein